MQSFLALFSLARAAVKLPMALVMSPSSILSQPWHARDSPSNLSAAGS